jgi:hypothetical protein
MVPFLRAAKCPDFAAPRIGKKSQILRLEDRKPELSRIPGGAGAA